MRPIRFGDKVVVEWCFPEESTNFQLLNATVVRTPQDVGDMWYVDDGQQTHAINPSCAWLVEIRKYNEEPEVLGGS